MKLWDYAKQMGVRYETAWRWFRDGKIQGQRIGPHTIIITEGLLRSQWWQPVARCYLCPRVFAWKMRSNLEQPGRPPGRPIARRKATRSR